MAQNTIQKPYVLHPEDELKRAMSNYLNISRNKNNSNYYRDYNYWPAEEAAWERLQNAIDKLKEG
jgi:hypothetical protein